MSPDLLRLLARGPATRSQLQAALGASQPTISRLIAKHAAEVAVLGRARATRYALRRTIRNLPTELPVYRISAAGEVREIGSMTSVHGGFGYENRENGRVDFFEGLPWFLSDMRPQGFLGRTFPHQYPELELPARITDWNDDHALYAFARRGEDLVGNLIVGEESFTRWSGQAPGKPIAENSRSRRYPKLATQALAGELPGSSAGGEQPKFLVAVAGQAGLRHVLVKFSEPIDTPAGQRLADLLVCENLVLETLTEAGIAAAHSSLLEAGGRRFLEVERFDRIGPRGRIGLISLGAVDDQFVGERRSWLSTALILERLRWLTRDDAEHIGWLQAFGGFIANTDMHFGNISLLYEGGRPLRLAPAYDMLPMLYAPQRGEVRTPAFVPLPPPPRAVAQARVARQSAISFWHRVAEDRRVSAPFQAIAASNQRTLEALAW